jgi:hypothetical protein
MKSILTILAAAAVTAAAGPAMAQVPMTTEEVRLQAARANAEYAAERALEPPVLERVSPGDYQAAARNEARVAQFVDFHRNLQAYMGGARSAPIAVNSEATAREEATRQGQERSMALHVVRLKSSPAA